MAPPRGRLIYSAVSLVLYTGFLAFYLLCATGRFRGMLGPRGADDDVPPHAALAWKLVNWVAVLLCCVADAYFVRSIVVASSTRRNETRLPPPPAQMDMC